MKTLYICEFSREDSPNESEWFVGDSSWTYEQQEENAYKHLLTNIYDNDRTLEEMKQELTVEGVYTVPKEMITEVFNSYEVEPITEDQARKETTCRGCGEPKDTGLVVCWSCFKYVENPYKTSGLDLAEWLKEKGVK